ncbi:MAG: hypothetical protein M3419_11920 [Actinomycetota bacterium]|nr:hypothetical protein [Actinomycetota bacterium]
MIRLSRGPVIGALATCLALSSTLTGSAVAGAAQAAPDARTTQTAFGLAAAGYGTRVQGGDVPAESGRTAFSIIACTKLAGLEKRNQLLSLINREGVRVSGVRTRQWTTRQPNTPNGVTVSSHSLTTIASVKLGDTGLLGDGLVIEGLRLKTRAFHDDRGFNTQRSFGFRNADLLGVPGLLDPNPGETITVPGVGSVTFFSGARSKSKNGARVEAKGLKVRVTATDSIVTVGSAMSRITNKVPAGVLGGFGRAGNARVLDGTIVSGKLAVQILPCQGTNGEWIRNPTARLDLPGTLVLGGAVGSARGDQISRTNAYGMTRGKIARAAIGGRGLVIRAIKAQANVRKDGTTITKTAKGTSVGSITVNGNPRSVPAAGQTVNLAGVQITGRKVVRTKFGIRVIALQVKIPGVETKVNLGEAFARITPN